MVELNGIVLTRHTSEDIPLTIGSVVLKIHLNIHQHINKTVLNINEIGT